jgi:hypothetical protein
MAGEEQVRGVRESRAIRADLESKGDSLRVPPPPRQFPYALYMTYMAPVHMHGFGFREFR